MSKRTLSDMINQGEKVKDLIQKGKVDEGIALLGHAAAGGDVESMYQLGLLYYRGKDVPGNLRFAQDWFERADNGMHAKAPYYIGRIFTYCAEHDVKSKVHSSPMDWHKEAMQWYKRSAERGFHAAIARMGMSYLNGTGVEPSRESAYSYFLRAKAAGNLTAHGKIVRMHLLWHRGIGGFFLAFCEMFSGLWSVAKSSCSKEQISEESFRELFLA